MHKQIEKIKKTESKPRVVKNIFSKEEIKKFINLYNELPITVHNKKQNVIKKRWLKNFNEELEALFYKKVKGEIGDFKMDNLRDEKNEDILGLFQESYNPIGLHVDAGFNLDEIIYKQTLIPLTSKGYPGSFLPIPTLLSESIVIATLLVPEAVALTPNFKPYP